MSCSTCGKTIALSVAFLTAICVFPLPTQAEDSEALAQGKVFVSQVRKKAFPNPGVRARGVIRAPMEKIWPLIDQCARYTETMQRVADSREISRNGNQVVCEITVDLPFPLSNIRASTQATHTVEPGKRYQRAWKLLEGDYAYNQGSWTLEPFQGSTDATLVTYETFVEPKTLIPDSIRNMAQKKTIPELYDHLRSQVK